MTNITISDNSVKAVQAGDKLLFIPNYLPAGNSDQAIIVSFDGSGNPQCSILVQGGGSQTVSLMPSQVLAVWRQL